MFDHCLAGFDVERVWDAAVRTLGEIGVAVRNEQVIRKVSGPLPFRDGRLFFPKDVVEAFASEIRAKAAARPRPPATERKIALANSRFCGHYVDPADGQLKPYDMETLIEYTRLISRLTGEGLIFGGVPGYRPGAAPELQLLESLYVDCCYNERPTPLVILPSERVTRYVLEIEELMHLPRWIGTELISPLRFMGDSIDIAIAFFGEAVAVGIDPMPIMGVTAPLDWHVGWAQSVAENLASYVIYRTYGFEDVGLPSFRLFLPNMACGMAYFSSPQHIFALLTRRKVHEFFGISATGCELMLITSKVPDQQAAIEKTAGCVLAKACGFTGIEGAGNLWMDEVFSPQQLMIDIEIANFVEHVDPGPLPQGQDDPVELIRRGVEAGSFLDADMTLDVYERFLWRPRLFDLGPRAAWTGRTVLEKAARLVEEKLTGYDYELSDDRWSQLDGIMARARKELG